MAVRHRVQFALAIILTLVVLEDKFGPKVNGLRNVYRIISGDRVGTSQKFPSLAAFFFLSERCELCLNFNSFVLWTNCHLFPRDILGPQQVLHRSHNLPEIRPLRRPLPPRRAENERVGLRKRE